MTQRVLVTAGANGIGRVIAQAFASTGARVWVTDIDPAALADCPSDWRTGFVDAGDETDVDALFGQIATDWGGLDVVVANAGVKGPTAPVEDVTLADWRACLATNLDGAFLAARGAARLMKPARDGVILLISSTSGLNGHPWRSPYAASKWGVIGLMRTLAMELGPHNIRVNALCPGAVTGPRMDRVIAAEAAQKGMTPDAVRAGYEMGVSLRRFVTPGDVAAMALFLAGPGGTNISGQALAIDGHTENPDPKVGP